ncbi:phosphatase PAP2 family protein [Devosia sp.]|uniref:phosphatase PAP2 family protein n=1 Tax=Devosia sp. TaxID=1871048 RepID=UPI003264033F
MKPLSPIYLAGGLAVLLLGGFGLIADEVIEGDTMTVDMAVLMALRRPGNPTDPIGPAWLPEAARDVTGLGSFSVLGIVVIVVVILLLLTNRARTAWFLAGSVLLGTVVSTVLKTVFDRPRPDLTGVAKVFTASFPSGHATLSAVVYLTLGTLLALRAPDRRLKVFYVAVAVFLTVIVGISRIYLGVHYPTDVLAGWSLGSAWALLTGMGAYAIGIHAAAKSVPNQGLPNG